MDLPYLFGFGLLCFVLGYFGKSWLTVIIMALLIEPTLIVFGFMGDLLKFLILIISGGIFGLFFILIIQIIISALIGLLAWYIGKVLRGDKESKIHG